jgi:hypothetical protein
MASDFDRKQQRKWAKETEKEIRKGKKITEKAQREGARMAKKTAGTSSSASKPSASTSTTAAPATQYTIQSSPGNPTPTAERPGRYDTAGKYMGASSPVQLSGGGGMSAKMAASVQEKRSEYPTHANPAGGTPKYTYNY